MKSSDLIKALHHHAKENRENKALSLVLMMAAERVEKLERQKRKKDDEQLVPSDER